MRVFISYNSRDLPRIEPVVEALTTFRPDWDAYFAPVHNGLGAYWIRDLGEQLAESDTVLLFLGKTVGPWQEIEFYDAWHRSRGQGMPRILPILLEDKAPALFFLGQLHHVNAKYLPPAEIARIIAHNEPIERQTPLWREVNPYAGLSAQGTESAAFFFGRMSKTVEILNYLRRGSGNLNVLVGNSGVGKSSIVAAGVLGALRSQQWPDVSGIWPEDLADSRTWLVITLKPGETPAKELVRAILATWIEDYEVREEKAEKWHAKLQNGSTLGDLLRYAQHEIAKSVGPAPSRIIFNIDQGEELYTGKNIGSDESRLFARLIAQGTTIPKLLMIASIRADYYGNLQKDIDLFPISTRIDIPPLTASEIEEVIRMPAQRLDAEFATPEIIPQLAKATEVSPGGLPLLSFMLYRAWEQMRTDDASDGKLHFPTDPLDIANPLVERAETFLRQNIDAKDALHRLFTLRLAHVPKIGEAVRRRTKKDDCQADEWEIATELAGEEWRLLTTSERDGTPMAEVAHETLLRSWPRLTQWLEAEREFLAWKGTLEAARQDYIANPGEGTLLMGTPLEKARDWLSDHRDVLSVEDRTFIEKSLEAEGKRQQQARAQEKRARIRLKWLVQGAIAAVILVSGIGIFASLQWGRAERGLAEAKTEIERRQVEWARYAAQKATELLNQDEPDQALAMAVSAFPRDAADRWIDIDRRSLVSEQLQEAWSKSRALVALRGHEQAVFSAAFSPNGTRIVTASGDNTARIWDSRTGEEILILNVIESDSYTLHSAAFSPDGSSIITASDDGTARIWDAETGEVIHSLPMHDRGIQSAAFSPDGTRIITASLDESAHIWDVETGEKIGILHGHTGAVNSAVFSLDGSSIVTASDDETARLWNAATGEEIRPLGGHEREVNSAAFSPDGSLIVTASLDGTARIWNAQTGEEIHRLRGHEGPVYSAVFSPDSSSIVTASRDGTVRFWDTKTGEEIRKLQWNEAVVVHAAFSPNGSRIITASWDKTARIWDAKMDEEIRNLQGTEGSLWFRNFSPDGSQIVTAARDNSARIWDTQTSAETHSLRGHDSFVQSAAFSDDGSSLVTAANDYEVRIWDPKTGERIRSLQLGWLMRAVLSPDGFLIVTTSGGKTARIWAAKTGEEIRSLQGHEDAVGSAAFSPDGSLIVTASLDRSARIWDTKTGEEIHKLQGHKGDVTCASFSPDGSRIVTASADTTVRLWDAETGEKIRSLQGHEGDVNCAAFSPNGSFIATSSLDRTARIWDAETGEEIQSLRGHEGSVYSAAFSPDGTHIVTASEDTTARIWDVKTGEEILSLQLNETPVVSASFSLDGSVIVTAMRDNTARIWNAKTGELIHRLEGHKGDAESANFSPDGSRIVTASKDGTAHIWDAETGAEIRSLQLHWLISAILSPDGTRIATVSGSSNTVRIWDAKTGELIRSLEGHKGHVESANFSPDGSRIVTASSDTTVRLWDAETGEEIRSLLGHEERVSSAAFSPNGSLIVTASYDETARIWDAKTGEEIRSLQGHVSAVESASFSLDGTRIVTVSMDNTARIWDAKTGDVIRSLQAHERGSMSAFSPDGSLIVIASNDGTMRIAKAFSLEELVARANERAQYADVLSPEQRCSFYLTVDGCP